MFNNNYHTPVTRLLRFNGRVAQGVLSDIAPTPPPLLVVFEKWLYEQ